MEKQKKSKKVVFIITVAIILLLIDQISKAIIIIKQINIIIIPNVLTLQTVRNTGGAFGVAEGNTGMFIITNIIVLGLIIRFIYLQKDYMNTITLVTLFMILSGGFGNLIDRLVRGYVVDFIRIFPKLNFPNFNFADSYITIGWVVLASIFALNTYKEWQISKNKE